MSASHRTMNSTNFKFIPFLKTIVKEHEIERDILIKEYCKFIFTEGKGDDILTTIFQYFNIPDVSFLRVLNRRTNFHIVRNNTLFHYLSNAENDNEQRKKVPNLTMFRMLNRFRGVTILKCWGNLNVTEIMKYLDLARETVRELEIGEANIDLTKIF